MQNNSSAEQRLSRSYGDPTKNRFKTGGGGACPELDGRVPSPILTPPSSPLQFRDRVRSGGLRGDLPAATSDSKCLSKRARDQTQGQDAKTAETTDAASPVNIPMSKARKEISPGLEATSLNSLNNIPESKFLVGRSHYNNQPVTIEYYTTERLSSTETGQDGLPLKKQATTIRAIGDHQVIRTIGSGSTGKVKLAVNIRTQEKVAIKIISKKYIADPGKNSKETPTSRERRILREAAILNLADHPNIVKLYDLYETSDYYCMVFEYVDGGQMLDYIISHGKVKENVARKFFRQLLSAVSYCHQNGIVHRDLKIENVLIDSKGDVKLVDFGLSNFYDPNAKLKTFCGSLYFAAPELLRGIVYTGPEIDLWSLGIILYVLVCGKVPFDDKSLSALHEKIKSGKFALPTHLSAECRNLLQVMIEIDPIRRAQLHEVMDHAWTRAIGEGAPLPDIDDFVIAREPLGKIDPTIEAFMIREFPYQYDGHLIKDTLKEALREWNRHHRHPIVSLYCLASHKHQKCLTSPFQAGTGVQAQTMHVPMARDNPSAPSLQIAYHSEGAMPTMAARGREETGTISVPQRKRSDSLPGTPTKKAPSGGPSTGPKSKRTYSLQTTPRELESILEEQRQAERMETVPEEALSASALSQDGFQEDIKVRSVYLRGIFSVNTTTTRSARQLRSIIMRILTQFHPSIIFLDREGYFICEYQASASRVALIDDDTAEAVAADDIDISQIDLHEEDVVTAAVEENLEPPATSLTFGSAPLRSIRFEIHIVRVALLGLNGVQFKRISGDFSVYKNLCAQLLDEFNL